MFYQGIFDRLAEKVVCARERNGCGVLDSISFLSWSSNISPVSLFYSDAWSVISTTTRISVLGAGEHVRSALSAGADTVDTGTNRDPLASYAYELKRLRTVVEYAMGESHGGGGGRDARGQVDGTLVRARFERGV